MLWRLVAKLMFKAMVPLIAIAGVFSYGTYMRGGDPSIMWKTLAAGSIDRVSGIFSGVQNDAGRAVGTLSKKASLSESGKLEKTQVFTWQDAEGVTHYSSTAPGSGTAQTVTVDPNVNVVAPVRAPVMVRQDESGGDADGFAAGSGDTAVSRQNGREQSASRRNGGRGGQSGADAAAIAEVEQELGGSLPGVAGQILSGQAGDGAGQGMDSSQLIRMLQSSGN